MSQIENDVLISLGYLAWLTRQGRSARHRRGKIFAAKHAYFDNPHPLIAPPKKPHRLSFSLQIFCKIQKGVRMPVNIEDDIETALIEIAAIYAQHPDREYTGGDVARSLRSMAQRLHEMRREWEAKRAS